MIIVINFFEDIKKWRIGFAAIMYYKMLMKCEVMKGKDGKFWIKMPCEKLKFGRENICQWPSRQDSNFFQTTCLEQLEEKFKISRFK